MKNMKNNKEKNENDSSHGSHGSENKNSILRTSSKNLNNRRKSTFFNKVMLFRSNRL